jgi:methionyl-tRNA formyltransferase
LFKIKNNKKNNIKFDKLLKMNNYVFSNIALAGDIQGINILMKYIPKNLIKCILAASNRPQDVNYLEFIAFSSKKKIIFHLDKKSTKYELFLEQFKEENIDLLICSSYSMILDSNVLQIVNNNALNFHFSLLPKYRGLNPIQYAIMNNELETGLTVHKMNENINAGDIIFQEKIKIDFTDTWNLVLKKNIILKENYLKNYLNTILENKINVLKQDELNVDFNKKINKAQLEIKPDLMSDLQIYNLIRANTDPLKSAYFIDKGKKTTFSEFESFENVEKYFAKYR